MKPHSNKQIHLEVMEPVLRSFWELEVLDPPSQALLDSDWLTYKLPEWIQDHCVSHCGICSNKFNVFRRKVRGLMKATRTSTDTFHSIIVVLAEVFIVIIVPVWQRQYPNLVFQPRRESVRNV